MSGAAIPILSAPPDEVFQGVLPDPLPDDPAALKVLLRAQQAAFLQIACGSDLALREQVHDLLQAGEVVALSLTEGETRSLDVPPSVAVSPGPAEKPGDRIGRYKILQRIGEGGCGVVYMADQEEPVHGGSR